VRTIGSTMNMYNSGGEETMVAGVQAASEGPTNNGMVK